MNSSKKKILSNIFFCIVIVCIYLSGERANFVKGLIIFFAILLFVNNIFFVLKKKYIFLLIIITIISITFLSKDVYERQRRFFINVGIGTNAEYKGPGHLLGKYKDASIYEKYGHLRHFAHFDTAWNIFKDYPIFGVGNLKFKYVLDIRVP